MFLIASNLHRDYRDLIATTLGALCSDYPRVKLEAVTLFEREGDRSLGYCEGNSKIVLNAFWFARPREVLEVGGNQGRAVARYGAPLWHGGMKEPQHVLHHEFGHLVMDVTPGAAKFAKERHQSALWAPQMASTGYALYEDEWFAEEFAGLRLGVPSPAAADLQAILSR